MGGVVVDEQWDFSSLNNYFVIEPVEIFYASCTGH